MYARTKTFTNDELDRDHIEYIVGMRMRKAKEVGEVLKTGGKYKVVRDKLRVKEVWHDANRYIICLMVYKVGLSAHRTPVTPKATAVFQPKAREKISPLRA
jgi:hypothetical protein